MPKKTDTPVVDHIRQMLSAGCPMDAAILSADAFEREITRTAKDSAYDLDLIKRLREKDRLRKQRNRAASGGRIKSPLVLVNTDSNLSVRKQGPKKSVRGTSMGRPLKGIPLPDDWCPSSGHYAEGQRRGLTRQEVDDAGERMRHWATAEGHRAIARKDDRRGWDACFLGTWLIKAADEKKRRPKVRGPSLGDIAFGRAAT